MGVSAICCVPRIDVYDPDEHIGTDFQARLANGYLDEWLQRVDPAYVSGQDISEESLLNLLNVTEASHRSNWGRDLGSGVLYPVDVEVINLAHFQKS